MGEAHKPTLFKKVGFSIPTIYYNDERARMRRARKAKTNTFNRMIQMMWRGLDVRTNSGNDLVDTKIRSADGRKDQWNGKTIDESRVSYNCIVIQLKSLLKFEVWFSPGHCFDVQ